MTGQHRTLFIYYFIWRSST